MTAETSLPGQIGRYEIKAVLGRGGMGTVFHAYDPRFEREVALKVLPFHLLGHEGLRARFEREAKTIAALEHPAIVPVYDFDEHEGQPFLVMRLMPGGTLSDRLAQGPLSTDEVARILKRIGDALDEAHSQGIIHRDLKPGNILFDKYGNAYLSDFGIVRLAEGTGIDLTGTGMVGTPGYMSPEQIQGKTIDGRTDIYALGVLVFEMLTAQKPFNADTPAMIMMKQITDPIPQLHEHRPDLPPDMDAIIERSLSRRREDRPDSAQELAQLLQAAVALIDTPIADQPITPAPVDIAESKPGTPLPPPVPPTVLESETPSPLPPAATVVAKQTPTPPPDTPLPADPSTADTPVSSPSRPRWLPALIVVIGIIIIFGAIGTAALVISQLTGDDDTVVEDTTVTEPDMEPAGENSLDNDQDEETVATQPDDEQILDADPEINEALILLEEGDIEGALAIADDILADDPENIPALEIRHFALRDLGRFDEAIATAERMVDLEPDNSGFLGELAVTQDWAGDTEAAIATVEQCVDQDPEYAGCWFLLGVFHQFQGDLQAAKEALLAAWELEPDNSELNRELAFMLVQTGDDLDFARELADKAVELDPEYPPNWYLRAQVAMAIGADAVANESFRRYLEIAPEDECTECIAEAEAFVNDFERNQPAGEGNVPQGGSMFAIMVNYNQPGLEDVRVRQALALAIDRDLLAGRAREAGFMDAEPSPAWLHPGLLNVDNVESGLPFTPDMAQFILAEAGFEGGEGLPPLFLQTNPDPRNEVVLTTVQEMWQDVLGIEVRIELIEEDYIGRVSQETPPLYRLGYSIGPNYTPMKVLFDFFATDGEANFIGYSNPDFDLLLEEAAGRDNFQERQPLFIEADNLVTAGDTVVIPLFYFQQEQ